MVCGEEIEYAIRLGVNFNANKVDKAPEMVARPHVLVVAARPLLVVVAARPLVVVARPHQRKSKQVDVPVQGFW